MFRNLRLYRLNSTWPTRSEDLADLLQTLEFTPCSPFSERSAGWEAPGLPHDPTLCRRVNGADLLRLRCQSRILPVAAIREALEARLDDYRTRMDQEPPRRVVRQLRDETRDELLPKALLKSDRLDGFCIPASGILGINTSSAARAELFLDLLRGAIQGCELEPVSYQRPLGDLLTAMFLGDLPDGMSLGLECRMQDPSDTQATVVWKDVDLTDPAIRTHVIEGMQVTHLAIEYRQVMQCLVSQDGLLSKIRFTGDSLAADTVDDHPLTKLDADFVLATGTLRAFLQDLEKLLGGYATEHQPGRAAA